MTINLNPAISSSEYFRKEATRIERLKHARKLVVARIREAGITELIPMHPGAITAQGYITVPQPTTVIEGEVVMVHHTWESIPDGAVANILAAVRAHDALAS